MGLPAHAPEGPLGSVALCEGEEVTVMALANRLGIDPGREALARVRAHHLEHHQPGGPVGARAAYQEALGDEAIEHVEVGAGDVLRRLDRRAAGEHSKAGEALLLVVVEQVVAPVDRRAQRPLACWRIPRAGRRRAESRVQALGDLRG